MLLLAAAHHGCLAAFVLVLLAAAWRDIGTMRIANGFPLGIALIFCVWLGIGVALDATSVADVAGSVAAALGVAAIGSLGFALNALGGGDVKLASAASLFAGPTLLPDFLLVTALAGGAAAAVLAAGRGYVSGRGGVLPYAPAIAVGGLWVGVSHALA